jgi:hypothetical protein
MKHQMHPERQKQFKPIGHTREDKTEEGATLLLPKAALERGG